MNSALEHRSILPRHKNTNHAIKIKKYLMNYFIFGDRNKTWSDACIFYYLYSIGKNKTSSQGSYFGEPPAIFVALDGVIMKKQTYLNYAPHF